MGFENIYNQDVVTNTIKNGLINNKLSQSMLFYGEVCSGKLTTALAVAKAFNCLETPIYDYCDECLTCKKIERFSYPDVFVIDSDSYYNKFFQLTQLLPKIDFKLIKYHFEVFISRFYSRAVAEYFPFKTSVKGKRLSKSRIIEIVDEYQTLIRNASTKKELTKAIEKKVHRNTFLDNINLIESFQNLDNIPVLTIKDIMDKMNLTVTEGKRKVFIFNGIEYMRVEGSNTFLKSIEEPPKHSQIILITNDLSRILQTIKSRCYLIEFKRRDLDELIDVYSKVYGVNLKSLSNNELSEMFKYNQDILYKKYFISLVEVFYQLSSKNASRSYKSYYVITDFARTVGNDIKKASLKDLLTIKEAFISMLNIIKMAKNSYEYTTYIENHLKLLTVEDIEAVNIKLRTIVERFTKKSIRSLDATIEHIRDSFRYMVYNNVDVEMSLTDIFLKLL